MLLNTYYAVDLKMSSLLLLQDQLMLFGCCNKGFDQVLDTLDTGELGGQRADVLDVGGCRFKSGLAK